MANSPQIPLSGEIIAASTQINTFRNQLTGRDVDSSGVYSAWPFSTPKYMKHRASRDGDKVDTLSRMFIQVAPNLYKKFLASLPDEETRSIARVLTGDNVKQGGVGYIDFLLQNVNHTLSEKVQIVETLSDSYVAFFFGTSAPVWQYAGTLLNTYQDDWAMRMFRIFDSLGRGTQLARNKQILRLRYDSMIVSGAMTNFQWSLNGDNETACPFSFSFLVKNVQIFYGGISHPTRLVNEKSFTPQNFQLEGSGVGSEAAMQTYIGGPPGLPGGVSEINPGPETEATDVTGTTQIFPENFWENEFGF